MTKRQLSIQASATVQDVVATAQDMEMGQGDMAMIMSLPPDSAARVLFAYQQAGSIHTGSTFLQKLVMMRWNALFQGIFYQSQPERFIAGARPKVPTTWQQCKDEYEKQYKELRRRTQPGHHDVAKKWRSGKYPRVDDQFEFYPHHTPGLKAPPPKSSKRQMTHLDTVRKDEFYPAPADDKMAAFAGEDQQQPGFLAGCSYGKVGAELWDSNNPNMPQLSMLTTSPATTNYAWLPLARRVDIDRVFRVIKDSGWFTSYECCGSLNMSLKHQPWAHMSPYKVAVTTRDTSFRTKMEIGVTDEGTQGATETRRSSSGARLYCMGKPEFTTPILLMVAQLMLESDFDVGVLAVRLKDGTVRNWGVGGGRRDGPKLRAEVESRVRKNRPPRAEGHPPGGCGHRRELAVQQLCAHDLGHFDLRVGGHRGAEHMVAAGGAAEGSGRFAGNPSGFAGNPRARRRFAGNSCRAHVGGSCTHDG